MIIQSELYNGYTYAVIQDELTKFRTTINGSTIGISSNLERAYQMVDDFYTVKLRKN